jgi:hypothetical protein
VCDWDALKQHMCERPSHCPLFTNHHTTF